MSFADWLDRQFAELGAWLCTFGEPACMSGYGAFVWVSIVVTLLALVLNASIPVLAHRRLLSELRDTALLTQSAARAEGDASASNQ